MGRLIIKEGRHREVEVEAGQVRLSKETSSSVRAVVLVTQNISDDLFNLVTLESGNESFEFKRVTAYENLTGEFVKSRYPILLDAELTYSEAK